MKLLIVGSDKVFSIENFYVKYLNEMGVNVKIFTAQTIFYDYYFGGNIVTKVLFKLGLSSIHKKINFQFKQVVSEFKPEIIWVFKGMEITPMSLKWAKKSGIKLVNYNPDNPFIFSGKGSGNSNITKSICLYDFHFTYNLEVKSQLENEFKATAYLLPFGFDISAEVLKEVEKEAEIIKTCFVGNPDSKRVAFIKELANEGVDIDIYGNGWSRYINHKRVTIHQPVYELELWKVLRRYRVQLNPLRIHNTNSHGMRSFEVPAIGGVMLAQRTDEHAAFYEEGKEAFFYDNAIECALIINKLLLFSKNEADVIRLAARKRCMTSKYSYKDRTYFVLETLKRIN